MTRLYIPAIFLIVAWALLLSASHALATDRCSLLQKPFTATYHGSYKGWRVNATQQLSALPKQQWQFTLMANNPIGHFTQESTFTLDKKNAIHSSQYRHTQKILIKNSLEETFFDWKNKKADSARGDKKRSVTLQGGELDELNYQLALRCDLIAGQTEFSYQVVDWKRIDKLDFKIVGEQSLTTALGTLDTVIVKRIRNDEDRITTLWFAKDLDYLMVKLLQEEKKDTEAYLLYIESINK